MTGRTRAAPAALAVLLAAGRGGPPHHDLVLVAVDTLRADHLGAFGSTLGATPHLDRLAAESVRFEAAYAPAPFTLPSIASLLTGRYPDALGVRTNMSSLPEDVETLATELHRQGWRTGAVVSSFVLRRSMGLARGFEHYDDETPQAEATRPIPERLAPDTTDAALAMLDRLLRDGGRFFLWVHYQDPPGPYTPPPSLRERFAAVVPDTARGRRSLPVSENDSGRGAIPRYQVVDDRTDVAFYRAGYAGEVTLTDREIGRLLEGLDERGLRERTVVAFTSDHGEAFGEDDLWFAHGEQVHDALVRVPLLLRVPGRPGAARSEVASLLDLRPTLVRAVGAEPTEQDLRGRDLLAPGAAEEGSRVLVRSFGERIRSALVAGRHKLVVEEAEHGFETRLYRLGEDGVDRRQARPELHAELRDAWQDLGLDLSSRGRRDRIAPLAPEEVARLRALGYGE